MLLGVMPCFVRNFMNGRRVTQVFIGSIIIKTKRPRPCPVIYCIGPILAATDPCVLLNTELRAEAVQMMFPRSARTNEPDDTGI